MLAWWDYEPHGELRDDLRTAHQTGNILSPHMKKGASVSVGDFLLEFNHESENYEDTVGEYYRETRGMSLEEKFDWEMKNHGPDLSQLSEEDRAEYERRKSGVDDGNPSL